MADDRSTAASGIFTVVTALIFFAGALSIVKLIEFGFDLKFDFEQVIQYLVDEYKSYASAVAAYFEPYIKTLLLNLRVWFGWDVQLYPHWKHVFVLLGIYFFRDSRMFLKLRYYDVAMFSFVWGALVAFVASVIAGVFELKRGDMWGNFVIAATPVLGFFFYVVGATLANAWWRREDSAAYLGGQVEEFWPYLGRRVRRNLIVVSFGIVFLAVCLLLPGVSDLLPAIREMKSPGLILLAVLIVALAAYWLWRGFNQANRQVRDKGVAFATAFFSSGNVNLSIAMLAPFASTVLIILFDQFLKLVA